VEVKRKKKKGRSPKRKIGRPNKDTGGGRGETVMGQGGGVRGGEKKREKTAEKNNNLSLKKIQGDNTRKEGYLRSDARHRGEDTIGT